ncbi:protein RRP5 homolog [Schistocerca serialis cubense]|uniref:protein RRP5 homolog n=1 Tax=Schistocerca serialis cubense TaxID=2023355 RepID=UPI00214F2FE4|nr:protein RRP5 homolog [Schistocerca serialis cubense]
MVATAERSFPRGGTKPGVALLKKQTFSLFGKKKTSSKKPSRKQQRKLKKGAVSKVTKVPKTYTAVGKTVKKLTYKELIEGMLVLGCVKEVREYDLSVNLPGCLVAKVPVTNISAAYTSVLQSLTEGKSPDGDFYKLRQIFLEGQHVVCKVTQVRHTDTGGHRVTATLAPHELHADCPPASLVVQGTVLTTAVKSVEDHGYVMDTGMFGVRAFLKKDFAKEYERVWNSGRPLGVGQLVRCVVSKAVSAGNVTTVSLTAVPNAVASAVQEDTPLHCLLPGALVNITIAEVLRNGLRVLYNDDKVGYISERHLSTPGKKLQNYSVGSELKARLLYILPAVKIAYFSLDPTILSADLPMSPFTTINIGDIIVKAKVIGIDANGVSIRLGKKNQGLRGLVSTFRIRKELSKEPEVSLIKRLGRLYPIGAKQKCKVIGYDFMERLFFCTFEKNELEDQPLGKNPLSLGQKVRCIVKKIVKSGLAVQVIHGKKLFDATVPPLHMSDVPLQHPKKKFTTGLKFNGRVLSLKDGKLRLTLKPSLVSSKVPPVTKPEDVIPGLECEGVIVHLSEKGALIAFYGDARGWLPAKKISLERVNPATVFYLGQVVCCYVDEVNLDKNSVILTLLPHGKASTHTNIKFGTAYNLVVKSVQPDGLHVAVEGVSAVVAGLVPLHLLSDHTGLLHLLLQTFQTGETLHNVFCCEEGLHPKFTLRQSLNNFFNWWASRTDNTVGWEALEKDLIVPSVVTKVEEKGVSVQLLFPGIHNNFFIPVKDLSDVGKSVTELGIQQNHVLTVKILRIVANKNKLVLSAKVSHCWNGNIQDGVLLLASYLHDKQRILHHLSEKNEPLAHLKPGMVVEGCVSSVSSLGAVLQLTSGVRAVVESHHYNPDIKIEVGAKVTGKVIMVDVGHNCVDVTLRPDVLDRIGTNQDLSELEAGLSVRAETLLVKPECVIVSLRGVGLYNLASVPTRRHINDILPFTLLFSLGKVSKVVLQLVENDLIIALPKTYVTKPQLLKKTNMLYHDMLVAKNSGTENKSEIVSVDIMEGSDVEKKQLLIEDVGIKKELENSGFDAGVTDINSDKRQKNRKRKISETEQQCSLLDSHGNKSLATPSKAKEATTKKNNETSPPKRKLHVPHSSFKEETDSECVHPDESHLQDSVSGCPEFPLSPKKKLKDSSFHTDYTETEVKPLGSGTKFIWNADPSMLPAVRVVQAQNESSSDEGDDQEVSSKKRKKLSAAERRELARQEEEKLREAERRLADSQLVPQSADDFDRLVLASPNSSMCWIKYMAFHLQATEIEKARAVAFRALKTISFREEQEKLNVWVALLNLENLYGTKESLDKVLEDAVQANDPFKVNMQMLQIYADSGKLQEVDQLIGQIMKRFSSNKEMWLHAGGVLLRLGQLDKARDLLQKALSKLDKKLHVEVISRFAHLENKHGSAERAQTLMEHILASYPKRVDVWCSYVDMLVKAEQFEIARKVLERAVAQHLPARKMKALFKKFLQFEEQHGTPEGAERVRQMALDYVESSTVACESEAKD